MLLASSYFITGTDTAVGKTYIAAALVKHFVASGYQTIGMKPIAAGYDLIDGELTNADVQQLTLASNVVAPPALITQYAFTVPIAPHIAAEQLGINISLDVINNAYLQLEKLAQVVIVEGAGGFFVPLATQQQSYISMADLAGKLKLPIILVVGMRLGCINHALLTVEAITSRGLLLAGWVANQMDDTMLAYQENLSCLKQLINAPCLAEVKWGETPNFE